MTEDMAIMLAVILVMSMVFGLCSLALSARIIERNGRVAAMLLAQADESRKVLLCYAEKAMSRLMAAKMPESHRNFRSHSGPPVADGTQHKVKQHFGAEFHELESMAAREAMIQVNREAAVATAQARAAAMPVEQFDVGTAMDFEQRNGAPT